ncbi:MAG: hypothetical protein ROO76_07240 [Terriglobia bacterium]|nr:hypothetical protein [Terriglobia bacterium]
MSTRSVRILAIDPGLQYLGVAILEGEELLWYGVKTFPKVTCPLDLCCQVRRFLTNLAATYSPSVVAIESPFYPQAVGNEELNKLTAALISWAKWKGLKVVTSTPPEVKAFFCRDQKTKQSLAEAMISRYPFLARYLSPLPWRRRYWFYVFDAVGLGLMCVRKMARS